MFFDRLFGKNKKEKSVLDAIWNSMDMNCHNNYKEAAQEDLKKYEETLEKMHQAEELSRKEYDRRKTELEEKKKELKSYDHKQHIGW